MRSMLRAVLVGLVAIVVVSAVRAEEGWVLYQAKDYGFSMLMPAGTRYAEKESAGGWGELWAEHDGVKFYALAKLGEQATPEEIEKVGVQLTGIPGSYWKTINQGQNQAGWTWFRTVQATKGGKLILGDYGTGSKGSYLLLLETTEADFIEYKADYTKWYGSIRLN